MAQSATPVTCHARAREAVPEVLPVVMPAMPAVPEVLPAPPAALALPGGLRRLPPAARAELAAALAGPVPGGRQRQPGDLVRVAGQACWDEREYARLRGFLETVDHPRDPRGRVYPLGYLLALPLVAGMAGDDETEAAAEWTASAPEELLVRLGAPRDRAGRAGRPDATTIGRVLGDIDQGQYDAALCSWAAARARAERPGMRKHLRIDGKALHGARRDGRTPMLLSGSGRRHHRRPAAGAQEDERDPGLPQAPGEDPGRGAHGRGHHRRPDAYAAETCPADRRQGRAVRVHDRACFTLLLLFVMACQRVQPGRIRPGYAVLCGVLG